MNKKPSIEDSAQRAATKRSAPKRQLSKWDKERRRRRILGIIISVVIAGVVISGGIVAYVHLVKPWHQPIVKVNDKVYDMDYFVKMLRVQRAVFEYRYGVDMSQYYTEEQQGQVVVNTIQTNELVRQKAEELSEEPDVDIMDITDADINERLQSWFGFDPDGELTLDEFNKLVNDSLESRDISRGDFEKMVIIPIILSDRVEEVIGNKEYPIDATYDHVKVKAVLLGTEEEAEEVRGNWEVGLNQIVKDYSPARYYPRDGYWLVMVTEGDGEGEEGELYINAMLLATREKADEVTAEFDGSNFAELAETYSLDSSAEDGGVIGWLSLDEIEEEFGNLDTIQSLDLNTLSEPISQNYPDNPVEWLPKNVESTSFDEYAFGDGAEGSISDPIRDTTYSTKGGYWLVMVTEGDGEGEEGELYINAILLDSEEKAEELKTQIEDGGDFAAIAQENSLDSSKEDGGDMGWMSQVDIESKFGTGVLAIINGLGQDEISTPIETIDGYWLVMVTEGDGEGEEGELYIKAILLDSKEKAEELKTQIEDGGDFATIAQENSLDSSAEDGGDIGWMSQVDIESKFGAGVLAIINGLGQDEISTPVYDEDVSKQSGYWVIEVLDREDRTLIETHRDSYIEEYYSEWFEGEMEAGKEEGRIKDYLDENNDKISWAFDHL